MRQDAGVDGDAQRISQLCWLFFLKIIDDQERDGRKIITDVKEGDTYKLLENSITFVQIESKIRLPEYIALRFNLRIKHVHRGLLLGTGPLVDPGFAGELLIPLHNLTSKKYEISVEEGIIWIEFTKTSHNGEKWPSGVSPPPSPKMQPNAK